MIGMRGAAAGAFFLLTTTVAGSQVTPGSVVVAAAYGRNAALQNYTFHVDVAMSMRHFPWLHFHLTGDGQYNRCREHYTVHLIGMPFFAKKIHDIDLSVIDPTLWPKRYKYHVIGVRGDDTLFDVSGGGLHDTTVALNPRSGVDWADVTYSDGTHIHLGISSSDVNGYLLPETLDANVKYSNIPLTARATVTDYELND
jgi:hypothetical protein